MSRVSTYARRYGTEYRSMLRLALPVVAAQLGQILVQLADNIMVGRYGGEDAMPLAAVAFGITSSFLFFITGLGITLGLTPLTGEHFARGERDKTASCLKHAIVLYTVTGAAITLLQLLCEPLLHYMGQPPEVVHMALPYYRIAALGIVPVMLFGAFKQFLEGIGNTLIPMIIVVGCNLLNIFLNWLFIFGHWGCPELGATGAGVATFIARWAMPLAAWLCFRFVGRFRAYIVEGRSESYTRAGFAKLLAIGFPIAVQMFLEAAAFVITSVMAGWFDDGELSISANQIAMTAGNCAFMISCALGAAATIRVSHGYGRRDVDGMSLSAHASLHLVVAWSIIVAAAMAVFNGAIPHLFTDNSRVAAITSTLLLCVAGYQIFDGLQCVSMGIVRGFQDVKIIPLISFLAYIVFNIPVGYLCGFVLGAGPAGLYAGYVVGLGLSAVLLLWRIKRKTTLMRRAESDI